MKVVLPKYHFLVVSRKMDVGLYLETILEKESLFSAEVVETAQAATRRLSRGGVDCIIFLIDLFSNSTFRMVQNIRRLGYEQRILIITEEWRTELLEEAEKLEKLSVFLKHALSLENDIHGIIVRVLGDHKVTSRRATRYGTRQRVFITTPMKSESSLGWILNMSRDGAYLEMPAHNLFPGQEIELDIKLEKVGKSHHVVGVVAWVTDTKTGGRRVGIRYKNPLKKTG